MDKFKPSDYWKGIVLYGLNSATYKMALGKVLLKFARQGTNSVSWEDLSEGFLQEYQVRLSTNPMPQQVSPSKMTVMERITFSMISGRLNHENAVEKVGSTAFNDVIPRFQTIGTDKLLAKNLFYEFEFGKCLILKDTLLHLGEEYFEELDNELSARWNLLEGAFTINRSQKTYRLANDIREVYLYDGHERTPLTQNIPFLQGYQGNMCFYCGQPIVGEIHVDHLFPRQVIQHDQVWNLVLAHRECNLQKSDHLVGPHFVEKLAQRNENIMGSNHPWKSKISSDLGNTRTKRQSMLKKHYENMKTVLGSYYWGGSKSYNPATDPFFTRLITMLNNSSVR